MASRRAADEMIAAGKVAVNGKIVRELGTIVDEEEDRITVNGTTVKPARTFSYIVMNKPAQVMTTMRDPEGRRTIVDVLPKGTPRIVPVGRLDYDTSGVLLLTNDGDLSYVLTHPSFGVEKTYRAVVRGKLTQAEVAELQRGVRLEEFRASAAHLKVVATRSDSSVVDLTIHEGKYRQVRRMFEALGHPVSSLTRLRFGPISLGSLKTGGSRPLTGKELAALKALAAKAEPRKSAKPKRSSGTIQRASWKNSSPSPRRTS